MKLFHIPVNRIEQLNEDERHLTDSLRQDHALLRGELAVLEKAESHDSTHLWQTLRDVCARLSIGLFEHIQCEERLLVIRNRIREIASSEATVRPSIDHKSDYRYLQVITHFISLENGPLLLNSRYHLLTGFLRGLHGHMDKQEAEFFPVIEQAMA